MTKLVFNDIRCPPSLNNLYPARGTQRVRSSEYRAWSQAAGWEIKLQWQRQGGRKFDGPYSIGVTAHLDGRRDPDNLWKALLDLLVELGIVAGDTAKLNRHHAMLAMPIYRDWPHERVHVKIESWPEPETVGATAGRGSEPARGISGVECGAGSPETDGVAVAHDEVAANPSASR